MSSILELLTKTWWTYDNTDAGFSQVYRWFNIVEGAAWCVVGGLIVHRFLRHRRSGVELLYAASFLAFAGSDFREAFVLQSWLILFKGVNLAAILLLRRLVIRRYYPTSKTF